MENILRDKMVAKARENGDKNGKTAELDFGAGAEWMYEQLSKKTKDIVKEIENKIRELDMLLISRHEIKGATYDLIENKKHLQSLLKKLT